MLSTVVLEELISSLLERSHNLMELAHSINSELMNTSQFVILLTQHNYIH